jgi:tetratricopeptide (TPR) repeat protein
MRIVTLFLLSALLSSSSLAYGKEYGDYDPKRILTFTETSSGKSYGIDGRYLDQILNDLSFHAKNYPTQFDSHQDRQRAIQDVKTLSGMLDILINGPNPHPELLWRAGFLNSMGHNLDILGSAEKAVAIFQKSLSISPSDPRSNYMYGTLLASIGKWDEALPYLQKAHSAGVADAAYSLGMTYLSLGQKEKALEHLEIYRQRNPNDGNIGKLIDGIRNGKLEIKKSSS